MRAGGSTTRPRRVVVLNWRDLAHPEGGGSEVYVHQVVQRLHATGLRVTWFTARYPGSSARGSIDGIEYVRRGGHVTVYLWAAWFLLTQTLTGRLGRRDAVLEVQNGAPFLARLFTRARVVVLVHHVHREQWSVLGPVLARVGWFLESRVAVRVDRGLRYVAVSDDTRRELVGLGVRVGDIDLAHNGVPPVPAYDQGEASPTPVIVVLSRLVPHKQIDHVIRAMPRLLATAPDLQLRIMGSGWWHDQLCDLTEQLGLRDRVTFLGHVSDTVKFEELSRAWVHVLPSLKEGWGLSIIEAAYAGTPSVAYASAGGTNESILDGVTGVLARDEDDLVAQVETLIARPELRRELGEKAQLRADEFTWDAAAARIRQALLDPVTPAPLAPVPPLTARD